MTDSAFQKRRSQDEKELQGFIQRLERLRMDFDRFFMGQERVAPIPRRDQLRRDLRASGLNRARNTALRFRFQNLMIRLASYTTYWERALREKEEGTRRSRNRS